MNKKLELRQGKFYRGGVHVPTEFGDKEQISLMNKQLEMINELNGDGYVVDPDIETTYTAKVTFECSCGQTVWFEGESDEDEMDAYEELVGEQSTCRKCKTDYDLSKNDDGDLVVKILKD